MRILQICHRVPYFPFDGGNIAMMNMALSLLQNDNEVYQFALNTKKHYTDISQIPNEVKKQIHFLASDIDTTVRLVPALMNIFGNGSYNVSRFYSDKVAENLVSLLKSQSFDIIQLETLFASPYVDVIRTYSKAKIILRAHNVEHIIWERLATSQRNPIKKRYISFLSRRLKEYELSTLKKIDAIVSITEVDERIFRYNGFTKPIKTIPLGVEMSDYTDKAEGQLALYHLGSMDWLPNQEGVRWFLSKCWPMIHKFYPHLKLYLAGRDFPKDILEGQYPNVECKGRVDSVNDFIADKQIMITPLLSGSGMRVKIIQAMAASRTVISTTIGIEGIKAEPGKHALIADMPEDFLKQIDFCMKNENVCRQIGMNARKLVEEKYSNKALGRELTKFLKDVSENKIQ